MPAVRLRIALAGLAAVALAGPAASPAATPLAGKVIAIDPGHNGRNFAHPRAINRLVDAGGFRKACDTTGTATADGRLTESAFNLGVALRLRRLLAAQGARVVLTRRDDRGVGPCIDERAAIGNRARADAAISIHADSEPPAGRGFHIIAPVSVPGLTAGIAGPSRALARRVRDALVTAGVPPSNLIGRRGLIERRDLGGLNRSTVPKVLVELGNMANAGEAARMKTGAYRLRLARALAAGLAAWVGRPG